MLRRRVGTARAPAPQPAIECAFADLELRCHLVPRLGAGLIGGDYPLAEIIRVGVRHPYLQWGEPHSSASLKPRRKPLYRCISTTRQLSLLAFGGRQSASEGRMVQKVSRLPPLTECSFCFHVPRNLRYASRISRSAAHSCRFVGIASYSVKAIHVRLRAIPAYAPAAPYEGDATGTACLDQRWHATGCRLWSRPIPAS